MDNTTDSRCQIRERCGMALAIVAVACLSSVIVQWSTHFPEEDAVLEQTLFGDLVDETTHPTAEQLPLRQSAVLPDLQPLPERAGSEDHRVAFTGVEPAEDAMNEPASFVPTVRFTEPAVAEPSSIQPASYTPSETANGSRLSGVIEAVAPENAEATSSKPGNVVQLGTITFDE